MAKRVEAFVQAVEVWVPDGERMRHHSGAYGGHTEFARVSARKTFKKGEGLPGTVGSTRRPVVWSELGSFFVRAELAKAAGIEAAVGLPIFRDQELMAVVVLLCGRRATTAGCIEVWDVDEPNGRLVHAGGYYGSLRRFETISGLLQFERGCGLPGLAWERGEPTVVENLESSSVFTRASLAREHGLEAGFGIPVYRGRNVAHVLVLLSAVATPLVRTLEVWVPEADGALRLERAAYFDDVDAFAETGKADEAPPERLPAQVLASGTPIVFERAASPSFPGAAESVPELGVGIPVHDGSRMRAVVVLSI
jgi:hypothetical protein